MCENLSVPESIPQLEESIHQHQQLLENITQSYTEVRREAWRKGGLELRGASGVDTPTSTAAGEHYTDLYRGKEGGMEEWGYRGKEGGYRGNEGGSEEGGYSRVDIRMWFHT